MKGWPAKFQVKGKEESYGKSRPGALPEAMQEKEAHGPRKQDLAGDGAHAG